MRTAVIDTASCGSDRIFIVHLRSLSHKVCPIKGSAKNITYVTLSLK